MPVDSLLNLLYVFFGFSRVLWLGYVGYVSVPCVCFSVDGCGRGGAPWVLLPLVVDF